MAPARTSPAPSAWTSTRNRDSFAQTTTPREPTMRLLQIAILAGMSLEAAVLPDGRAAAQGPAALSGQVSSADEGAMEGVLVSARRDGSSITTTVVSDDKGHYAFPRSEERRVGKSVD